MGSPATTISRIGNKAFTLIELAFVMVIMAVLLVTALPRFQGMAEHLRVERTAFELTQLLRYAHERAVSEGQDLRWVWDDEARCARLERVGAVPGAGQDQNGPESTLRFRTSDPLPIGVAVRVVRDGVPVDDVTLFRDGTSQPTTILITTEGPEAYTVTIDEATGQPVLTQGNPAR